MKITPEKINELGPNDVFVFGSNDAGIHGAGAAKLALKWGAKMGRGVGYYGQTYAIPTKDQNIKTLPLNVIQNYVHEFLRAVRKIPYMNFLVTQIGCGLAGYTPKDIAPLFIDPIYKKDIPDNVYLPKEFWEVLKSC
jgi:hypothetical protein